MAAPQVIRESVSRQVEPSMQFLVRLLAIASFLGFASTFWALIATILGTVAPLGSYEMLVVYTLPPVVLVGTWLGWKMAGDLDGKEAWKAVFRGSPAWLAWLVTIYLLLGFLVFFTLLGLGIRAGDRGEPTGHIEALAQYVLLSAFYAYFFGVFLSRLRIKREYVYR